SVASSDKCNRHPVGPAGWTGRLPACPATTPHRQTPAGWRDTHQCIRFLGSLGRCRRSCRLTSAPCCLLSFQKLLIQFPSRLNSTIPSKLISIELIKLHSLDESLNPFWHNGKLVPTHQCPGIQPTYT